MLKVLKLYPADHHSVAIQDCHAFFIEQQIPELVPYLESRIKQNPQLEKIKKGFLNEDFEGVMTSTPWLDEVEFNEQALVPSEVERNIKVEILDIAGVYHYKNKNFSSFFEQIAKTDNLEYFQLRSLQTLIDFNYNLVQKYLFQKLFLPYCVFHSLFIAWIFGTYEVRLEEDWQQYYWILMIINVIFATYFVQNELRQLIKEGISYLSSFWNYIDLIPPIGIYCILGLSILEILGNQLSEIVKDPESKTLEHTHRFSMTIERVVVSLTTLFMWFKFLYFFRIFQPTAYLIRMIVIVVIDMRHFLLVLFVSIIGFGNAFYIIALANGESAFTGGSYIDSILFSYRMVLGDFDTSDFGEVATPLVWTLFIMVSIFNIIVMLNLLIAIISDSYAAVVQNSEQATYQERASMIAENNYIIPDSMKESYARENEFLLIVTDLEQENRQADLSPIEESVKEFAGQIKLQFEEMNSKMDLFQEKQDKILEFIKANQQ